MASNFKSYNTSHPWITFELHLEKVTYEMWLILGETQSKCEHISGVPLLPKVADLLHQIYLAKGVLATTAIEGNTLTEREVRQRIEGKLKLPESKEYLGREIDNVVKACNEIGKKLFDGEPTTLTVTDITHYNALILQGLPLQEEVVPGKLRDYRVGVGDYQAVPPEDCQYLLERLLTWLNEDFAGINQPYKIAFGVLKAIVAHLYFAWIHPFGDGNGRTARLIEFQILLANGVPSAAAQLLSNHYNQTRTEYYRQLDYASKSGGDINRFIMYALRGFLDGLKEQLAFIRAQQMEVHWENFVYARFKDKESATDIRRRRLILDLTDKPEGVPMAELRYVSSRVAEAYAGKLDRTIQRDVEILEEMDLVVKSSKRVKANFELMYAFLPGRREEE